jgi:hypothetical protein
MARNLTRGSIGRQWMAIRDMDIAAEIIGVNPLKAKLSAFAVSSFYVGISGALFFTVYLGAVEVGEAFGIQKSFLVLFMIIIGGLGSLFGSFAGAAFMVLLPVALKVLLVDTFGWDTAIATHFQFVIVGFADHVLPDRGAARAGASLGASEGETEVVALPALRGAMVGGIVHPTIVVRARAAKRRQPGPNPGVRHIGITNGRKDPMKKLATMAIAGVMAASPALADLVFPSLSYRTGPFAANGIPFADGYADYFTLLNERDGGIGGVMTRVVECETAYNTERGVECYEATKGEGALVYQPLSTGITYQLIPRASADGIPIHSMGYGRTSAANGSTSSNGCSTTRRTTGTAPRCVNHLLDENSGSLDGQEDRAALPQLGLWPGADPHAGDAGRNARLRAAADRGRPAPARSRATSGCRSAASAPTMSDVGLGRDEPGRGAGSGQHPLPDGELHRHLVVGRRA